MWRNKFFSKILYAVIILLGLVPLLWYRNGSVAAGHDMGYSFSPLERMLGRLYVWSDAFNFGLDGSWDVGSIPLYLPEAILDWVGFPEQQVQMIVFVFWFLMPGLAMLYLLQTLTRIIHLPEKGQLPFVLFGSIFYMFNHYLLQGWFVAAKSEFSVVIITPFIITFLLKTLFLKENPIFYGLLSAILMTLFNASGATGVALFGGLMIVLLWFFVYLLILRFMRVPDVSIKNLIMFVVVLIFTFLALNAYWILPFTYYALRNYTEQLVGSGGTAGILNWIDAVSKHATFANLFRLQGFSGWYEIVNHPYSAAYIKNPLLILISFIFPALVIYSLYLFKKADKQTRIVMGFFFGLTLVALFFMSGTRTPLGIIYQNFVRYIPGFAIFRSPFYKFGYVLWIAYAVLIAFSLSHILAFVWDKVKNERRKYIFTFLSLGLLLIVVLAYSFPFFTGSFFLWNKPLSTMVNPPPEVFEFKEWMKVHNTRRILLYPPLAEPHLADAYTWNYWSLTPFPNLLSEKGIVSNNGFWSPRQKTLIEQLYLAIEEGDEEKVARLAKLLNISHILFRRDGKTDLPWLPLATTIDKYETVIKTAPWLSLEKTFGEWFLYRVLFDDQGKEFISIKKTNVNLTGLGHLDKIISSLPNSSLYFLEVDLVDVKFVSPKERFITTGCINCDLEGEIESYPTPVVNLLPNSIFYQYVLFKEKTRLARVKTGGEKAVLMSSNVARRVLELQKVIGGRGSQELSFEELALMVRVLKEVNSQLRQILTLRENSLQAEGLNDPYSKHMQSFINTLKRETQQLKYVLPRRDDIDEQFSEITNNLNTLQKITNQKLWVTVSEKEPRFVLQIPTDGQYSLSLLTERHVNYDEIFQNDFLNLGNLRIMDTPASLSATKKTDTGYDFGKIDLPAGQYRIFLQMPPYKNVSFFPKIEIPSYGEPFVTTIKNLAPNNLYQLDFDYSSESTRGINYKAVARLETGKTIDIQMIRLTDNYLSHQKILLTTPSTLNQIKEVTLMIDHSSLTSLPFPIILENITLRPLVNPLLLAKQEKEKKANTQEENGIVEQYQKVNPVLYTADISSSKGQFYLILNEGFSKGWKAYIIKDKLTNCQGFFCGIKTVVGILRDGEKISDENHLQAYGFSNAWFVENSERDKFYVAFFYFPQLFAYTGFAITFIGIGVSLLLLVFLVRRLRG